MASTNIIPVDETELSPKHMEALNLWIKDPNYAEVARVMGYSRMHARRLVLAAVQVRIHEILPGADEYLVLQLEIIEKRLSYLDAIITREIITDEDDILLMDDTFKAMQQERGYLAQLTKLLGLAAPEEHIVAIVPARPLTDAERQERIWKHVTHAPLLEDNGDSVDTAIPNADPTDRPNTAGADNGRPVDPSPG
ncbi:hypothetical protein LCGC14_0693600 [marine sediment metagenome]|uniref:Uncharacterized protein n=1 Tax=marine sediment metagenome TaxID=412755 RepID=A0A0F9QPM3_9ZZZZ